MNNHDSNSFPICSLAALTFTVLKLMGVINWSWWWVLSPVWIPLAFLVILFTVTGFFAYFLGKIK